MTENALRRSFVVMSCSWLALTACSALGPESSMREDGITASESEGAYSGAPLAPSTKFVSHASYRDAEPEQDRKMIYTAELTVQVSHVDEVMKKFLASVKEFGGYLSGRHNNQLICRVPASHFEEALELARGYGRVLSQSLQAQDVTKQHADLTIRLDNAKKSRARLLELLEMAEGVADILKIEKEIARLTTEIERLTGELKYLENQVALSTITLTLVSPSGPHERPRRFSRFPWINAVGPETIMRGF